MFPWLAIGALFSAIVAGCSSDSSSEETHESAPRSAAPPESPPSESPHASDSAPATPSASATVNEPCPAGMVQVARFCIDRYEASLTIAGLPHPGNERPPADANYVAMSIPGVVPQAYINRDESEQACRRARKRLCSLDEWLRSCRGSEKWNFPYGNSELQGKCNTGKSHLMSKVFAGTDPMTWGYATHFNNPILDATPGFLAKTGEFSECIGLAGAYDMVGNLHEWVSDSVDWGLTQKISLVPRLAEVLAEENGHAIFMGGYFSTVNEFGLGCNYLTIGHEAAYHDYSTGFRCCADPSGE